MRQPGKWLGLACAGLLAWGILAGGSNLALAQGASDARWNALFDRLIRLEHEVRALRKNGAVPAAGAGSVRLEGRLKALEAEIASLRKEMNRRLKALDTRLRRLEKQRGMKAGAIAPLPETPRQNRGGRGAKAPSFGLAGTETYQTDEGAFGLGGAGAHDPDLFAGAANAPRMTTTISPSYPDKGENEQLLGRLRVDDAGNPLPPASRSGAERPSSRSGGPRALPGVRGIYGARNNGAGMGGNGAANASRTHGLVPPPVKAAPLTPPSVQVARVNPDALLKRARDAFLARRYGLAVSSYEDFLRQASHHPARAEAEYELGEALYLQGRYREAGKAYLQSYKTNENSRVAPMALYKLGLSLKRLGQKKQACKTWKLLQGRYADSRAARLLAPVEMRRAKCRG